MLKSGLRVFGGFLAVMLVIGLTWLATGSVVKSGLNLRINQASLASGKG